MSWVIAAWFRGPVQGIVRFLNSAGRMVETLDSAAKFESEEQAKAFAAEQSSFCMRVLKEDEVDAWLVMKMLYTEKEAEA